MKAIAAVVALVLLSGCAARLSIPATVKQVAGNGVHIAQTVQVMTSAVEKAEQDKLLPRNAAIKVMVTLSKITDASTEAIKYLTLLLKSDSPTEASSNVDKLIAALEVIDTELLKAFIPIQDEELKTQLGLLGSEMLRTITIINREILGRVYAK